MSLKLKYYLKWIDFSIFIDFYFITKSNFFIFLDKIKKLLNYDFSVINKEIYNILRFYYFLTKQCLENFYDDSSFFSSINYFKCINQKFKFKVLLDKLIYLTQKFWFYIFVNQLERLIENFKIKFFNNKYFLKFNFLLYKNFWFWNISKIKNFINFQFFLLFKTHFPKLQAPSFDIKKLVIKIYNFSLNKYYTYLEFFKRLNFSFEFTNPEPEMTEYYSKIFSKIILLLPADLGFKRFIIKIFKKIYFFYEIYLNVFFIILNFLIEYFRNFLFLLNFVQILPFVPVFTFLKFFCLNCFTHNNIILLFLDLTLISTLIKNVYGVLIFFAIKYLYIGLSIKNNVIKLYNIF